MRSELLLELVSAISTLTQFAVSQELPWEQNGTPLYLKNKKKIYVDRDVREQTTLIPLLNGTDLYQDTLICRVYLAVDAKNPPSQLDQAISTILAAKATMGIVNMGVESDYTLEEQEDVLLYTFEFRMDTLIT
jgi:hypothetical protein